jgi:hypothetical protein
MYTLDHFLFDVKKQSRLARNYILIGYWTVVVKTCQFLKLFFPSYRKEARERRLADEHIKTQ